MTEWSDVRLKWIGFAEAKDSAALWLQKEGVEDNGDPLTALRSICLIARGSGISIFNVQPSNPSTTTQLPFTIELRLKLIDLTCHIKKTSVVRGGPLIIEYDARVLTDNQTVELIVDHPESRYHLRLTLASSVKPFFGAAAAISTVAQATSASAAAAAAAHNGPGVADLKAEAPSASDRSACKGILPHQPAQPRNRFPS